MGRRKILIVSIIGLILVLGLGFLGYYSSRIKLRADGGSGYSQIGTVIFGSKFTGKEVTYNDTELSPPDKDKYPGCPPDTEDVKWVLQLVRPFYMTQLKDELVYKVPKPDPNGKNHESVPNPAAGTLHKLVAEKAYKAVMIEDPERPATPPGLPKHLIVARLIHNVERGITEPALKYRVAGKKNPLGSLLGGLGLGGVNNNALMYLGSNVVNIPLIDGDTLPIVDSQGKPIQPTVLCTEL